MPDISLEELCTPPTSPVQKLEPVQAATWKSPDPEWVRYEQDVRGAIIAEKRAAMIAIRANKTPRRISVKSVLIVAKRSRSQLYHSHRDLKHLIDSAQAAVERLLEIYNSRAKKEAARPTVVDLELMIRSLRAEIRNLNAVNVSKGASEVFSLMFTRSAQAMDAEITQLRADNMRKDAQIQTLQGIISAMSSNVSLNPKIGTVIDVENYASTL